MKSVSRDSIRFVRSSGLLYGFAGDGGGVFGGQQRTAKTAVDGAVWLCGLLAIRKSRYE